MPPAVSIITVYYNTPAELLRLHESIHRFLPAGQWEWIIADNHSLEDLSTKLPGVHYLRLPENYGFAKANNLAARKASAPFLLFLNPDCELLENLLPPLMEALKSAGVAGPQVLNADGSIQLSFGPFLSILQEARQRFLTRYERSILVQKWLRRKMRSPFWPDYVSGCAMMIRSELFESMGGFDETFFLYEEDVDLCKRIRNRGLPILYVPAVKIQHARNRSVKQSPELAKAQYRKSQMYYYEKHQASLQQFLLKLYLSVRKKN